MLSVGCRFEVVFGVSKVCQVSQLYAAIDDLATRELGSMMPSLFTLQAFLFFFLMDMYYGPFFLPLLRLGIEISCSMILGRQMETDKDSLSFIYLFIQYRLPANTFLCLPNFQKLLINMWSLA